MEAWCLDYIIQLVALVIQWARQVTYQAHCRLMVEHHIIKTSHLVSISLPSWAEQCLVNIQLILALG